MPFLECKVYSDGSHYIAIPHTERQNRRRQKPAEENVIVDGVPTTKKAEFEKLYAESTGKKKKEVKAEILEKMGELFHKEEDAELFVEENMLRKKRNRNARRIRLFRKAALVDFDYFCTFTYDSDLMDETTFRKKLSYVFNNLSVRKGWRYIGVWERGSETERLHFHGVFHIPEGTLPGELLTQSGYNFARARREESLYCTYFKERFGRNEFAPIGTYGDVTKELLYMVKYIDKSGERIVYSRGLPQFFISDIMEEDIICPYDEEDDYKQLLYDDFACYDRGEYMGKASPETIAKMRKVN